MTSSESLRPLEKVRERWILFSGDMVRAILEGRKTQTRRTINPQPPDWIKDFGYSVFTPSGHISGRGVYKDKGPGEKFFKCPYGQPGDRLWVRETWKAHVVDLGAGILPDKLDRVIVDYAASPGVPMSRGVHRSILGSVNERTWRRWRPSIHMPRWASRITLEITSVRVERLEAICVGDLEKEGYVQFPDSVENVRARFKNSWNARYSRSWDRNEWVWVIEFKRLFKGEDGVNDKRF